MIFEQPEFQIAGDRALLMVLGDEMSFDLNFKVHSLARIIRESNTRGIIELIPEMASLLVSYDPDSIAYEDLATELNAMQRAISHSDVDELPSRIFYVPILYFDPWTRACVDDYRGKIKNKAWDGDILVETNGLGNLAALTRVHAATEYWVAALGFWPGLCSLLPLDPRSRLTAPKYDPPRTWTPKGTIGLGGAITCIYPDQTPGGYQIFARTPMPIWDRRQRLHAFKDSLALFRPSDRVRFIPISLDEYEYIERKVEDGTYEHSLITYQNFSSRLYRKWLADIDPAIRV